MANTGNIQQESIYVVACPGKTSLSGKVYSQMNFHNQERNPTSYTN